MMKTFKENTINITKIFEPLSEEEHIRDRNSPFYKAWKEAVKTKDSETCTRCGYNIKGSGGRLHAHHKKKFSEDKDGRFDIMNGEILCKKCHYLEHHGTEDEKEGFINYIQKQQ